MLSAAELADSAGLHYIAEPDTLPLRRVRKGTGFAYVDRHARAVRDDKTKARIVKLAVPPAWEDVKLARDPGSHIQAVGRDEAGRLQYKYHEKWTETGHEMKCERLAHLGDKLGEARAEIEGQLRRRAVDEDFALSCALALLDRAGLRVGWANSVEWAISILEDKPEGGGSNS